MLSSFYPSVANFFYISCSKLEQLRINRGRVEDLNDGDAASYLVDGIGTVIGITRLSILI